VPLIYGWVTLTGGVGRTARRRRHHIGAGAVRAHARRRLRQPPGECVSRCFPCDTWWHISQSGRLRQPPGKCVSRCFPCDTWWHISQSAVFPCLGAPSSGVLARPLSRTSSGGEFDRVVYYNHLEIMPWVGSTTVTGARALGGSRSPGGLLFFRWGERRIRKWAPCSTSGPSDYRAEESNNLKGKVRVERQLVGLPWAADGCPWGSYEPCYHFTIR
jgi:hypothetical protein